VVQRHLQPAGAPKRTSVDYRGGAPAELDCSQLAFVDSKGNPIYQVRQNGVQYDKITEAWRELKRKKSDIPNYRSLRKATNNTFCEMLNDLADGDDAALY
jgi:hypothetical protein